MIVLQISGLVCYSIPLGYPLISARAIIIISTYTEWEVSVPVDYTYFTHIVFYSILQGEEMVFHLLALET